MGPPPRRGVFSRFSLHIDLRGQVYCSCRPNFPMIGPVLSVPSQYVPVITFVSCESGLIDFLVFFDTLDPGQAEAYFPSSLVFPWNSRRNSNRPPPSSVEVFIQAWISFCPFLPLLSSVSHCTGTRSWFLLARTSARPAFQNPSSIVPFFSSVAPPLPSFIWARMGDSKHQR